MTVSTTVPEEEVRTSFREEGERMSPVVMLSVVGYFSESSESLEAVRARTLTCEPVERANLRAARPVPPVAPKMATVFCGEDMMLLCRYI
jgi:hypothetical protein